MDKKKYGLSGLLNQSFMEFHTPNILSKSMFFFPLSMGHFFCNSEYYVKRKDYNNYLLMYIKDGEGTLEYDEKLLSLPKNSLVFIDCSKPHIYKPITYWETIWIHFDGNSSKQFFELIYPQAGCVINLKNSNIFVNYLFEIIVSYKNNKPLPEPIISCHIQRLLTEILMNLKNTDYNNQNPVIKATTYIENNFNKQINISDISKHVSLSQFHLSRLFKIETGYSPYEYLLTIRLNKAKLLLKTTNMLIKEIAFETGFNSESNFVYTFKKNNNISPKNFRNTQF